MADNRDLYPNSAKIFKFGDAPTPSPSRLAELPDFLLLQILSRLPFSEVVRTGVLSSEWKNLWKQVDEIILYKDLGSHYGNYGISIDEEDELQLNQTFVDAAHHALSQCACFNINKFSLIIESNFNYANVLDKLIQWAFLRNVRVFTWICKETDKHGPYYRASIWFCHSSSLEALIIKGDVKIQLLGPAVSWSSLKCLLLSRVGITDEDIAKVLSGCPVLETLVLQDVSTITELNIVSPSVKTFRVVNQRCDPCSCAVNAPGLKNLEYVGASPGCSMRLKNNLEYVGPSPGCSMRLKNVSSLLRANINLKCVVEQIRAYDGEVYHILEFAVPLLESLFHVEDLVLGNYLVFAFSLMRLYNKPLPLFSCKRLTIFLLSSHELFFTTAYLYQRLCCVETLFINVEHNCGEWKFRQQIRDIDRAYGFDTPKLDFKCLKYVKISHIFRWLSQCSSWHIMKCYFRVAACIMKNANSLKELVIAFSHNYSSNARTRDSESWYFFLLFERFVRWFRVWFNGDNKWEITKRKSTFEIICKRVVCSS